MLPEALKLHPTYAIGILPLLLSIISYDNKFVLKHDVAYADDVTGVGGDIDGLKHWWEAIIAYGDLGYKVNASKSWLIVKVQYFETAKVAFFFENRHKKFHKSGDSRKLIP